MHFLAHQATASFASSGLAFGLDSSGGADAAVSACLRGRLLVACPETSASTSVTWHVRLRIRLTRPRARGFQRQVSAFVGERRLDHELVAVEAVVCPALATAERSTFSMSVAARAGERENRPRLGHAAPANVVEHEPRLAGRRANPLRLRANAHPIVLRYGHQRFFTWVEVAGVAAESPGRGELAELVPDHLLGHEDGHVLAPVVDRDGVPDHLGEDRRGA